MCTQCSYIAADIGKGLIEDLTGGGPFGVKIARFSAKRLKFCGKWSEFCARRSNFLKNCKLLCRKTKLCER